MVAVLPSEALMTPVVATTEGAVRVPVKVGLSRGAAPVMSASWM